MESLSGSGLIQSLCPSLGITGLMEME
uniref:CCD n=1 Tax=Arundo donax TaxID=35708 RepID=A0A0A9G038_ARUDO